MHVAWDFAIFSFVQIQGQADAAADHVAVDETNSVTFTPITFSFRSLENLAEFGSSGELSN